MSGASRRPTIAEIIRRWSERQGEWSRFHVQVDGAALAAEVIADLEGIAENDGCDELTLTVASTISGYSTDHLSRLLRNGTLPNAGRKGSPRIRRVDLPIRPKIRIATPRSIAYDPDTDARSLGARR
jgi:hypothetical protein